MYRATAVIESPLRLHGAPTFLDGERICGGRRLGDGDVLRCGDTLIAYWDPRQGFDGTSLPQNHKRLQRDL
jgi:hypothetical protein